MAGELGTGTLALMIMKNVNAGKTVGYPSALGVVIAVLGGALVMAFKTIMEKVFPEVEY